MLLILGIHELSLVSLYLIFYEKFNSLYMKRRNRLYWVTSITQWVLSSRKTGFSTHLYKSYENHKDKSVPGKNLFWIFEFSLCSKSSLFSGGFATGGWKLQMGWWQKCGNLWFNDCCHSYRSSWWNCRVILHVNCQSILLFFCLQQKLELFWGLIYKSPSIKEGAF